jgi:LPS sulfotransferase NodH
LVELPIENLIAALDAFGFTHFVLLERRNSFRKIISSLVAITTQQWHVPVGTVVPPAVCRAVATVFEADSKAQIIRGASHRNVI